MDSTNPSYQDSRTAAVATGHVLARMTPEQKAAWRLAEIPGNRSAMERGLDQLPFAFGWYAVCYSDELAIGEVKPMRYFATELAAWRGEDGKARVVDAYCRHLGAHMGYGGKVHGNLLECPFHAWRYDGTGAVNEIPYSNVIPPQAKAPCGGWPLTEANGFIWVWYHPAGAAPLWEVEVVPEVGDPAWTGFDRYEWRVSAGLQLLAENAADNAHFKYVHGTATYPDATVSYDGHVRAGRVAAKLGTPRGEVDGVISNGSYGPGQSWTRFTGISETLLVASVVPVEKDVVHARFAFLQLKTQAEGPAANLAKALIRDIVKQFDQDKVIWERQRYEMNPLICKDDGPIGDFRRWYSRFYDVGGNA
jgi:3-ketosteroid 9alpha-monooxygenase subunit A